MYGRCENGEWEETPVGDSITYSWSATNGQFPSGSVGSSVEWTAPLVYGPVTITVIADDSGNMYNDSSVSDSVNVTIILPDPEVQIRESGRNANRIAYNDPRPGEDEERIVIWHNAYPDYTSFQLVPIDGDGIWYKVYSEKEGSYIEEDTLIDILTVSGQVLEDNTDITKPDFIVYWESMMQGFDVHTISQYEYTAARQHFLLYLIPMSDFAENAYSRFRNGVWLQNGWDPSSTNTTVIMSAEKKLTHKFGANLTDLFPEIYLLRKLPQANVTMPVYYWANNKPTNNLIRTHDCFKNGIANFINNLSRSFLETAYQQAGGSDPKTIHIDFSQELPLNLLFGPNFDDTQICLGHVSIRPGSDPYYGNGYIELLVSKNGEVYDIQANPIINCTIEDVFDFNYFNTGLASWVGAPLDGASVQCGFGRSGSISGAGQVALIRIDVSGTVNVGPFVK
ncbi:MAG: hypothetical protein JXA82_17615 [Sedimentisphaerales bacterium]|nr:hypothetical protein [Sedimentisphaerales bacterium]